MDLKDYIKAFPDFPRPGILFYDMSPLLSHGAVWRTVVDRIASLVEGFEPDYLFGIESRGFLLASSVAYATGRGCVMIRKKGKLPGPTLGYDYALEYGLDRVEIQADALVAGRKGLLIDDLLATGGTCAAAITLLRQIPITVLGALFIIELTFLEGRKALDIPCVSLLSYDQ